MSMLSDLLNSQVNVTDYLVIVKNPYNFSNSLILEIHCVEKYKRYNARVLIV